MKTAIITGITGQDGAYLAEHLLQKNYKVIGAYRRSSSLNLWRLNDLDVVGHKNLYLVEHDLTDLSSSIRLLEKYQPDEFYNLAAQSFVGVSFTQPLTTAEITAIGPLNILEAIRIVNKKIKFYQASSSEMFGKVQDIPQTEKTQFYPRSPYGVSKLFAHWMTINYRESYDIFACSGILFNHESPLRGIEFVTRKISDSVAKIKLGKLNHFELGNLDAKRDWGFAKEYVEGMVMMLQSDKPDNYILSTGETTTVREFVRLAFKVVDIEIDFNGKGENTTGINSKTGDVILKINPQFFRPTEVDLLIGDPTKAKDSLGWVPKCSIENLTQKMVTSDLEKNS